MPRPSEYLRDLLKDARQFDPRAVSELGRWLDNVNGQADVNTQTIGGGSGAPLNAPYLVSAATAALLFERVLTVAAPLTATDGGAHGNFSLGIPAATSLVNGYLTAADWTTFNSKQPAGNYITALTGDVTASGPGSVSATLASIVSAAGPIGGATTTPVITIDAKGRVTALSSAAIVPAAGSITPAMLQNASSQYRLLTSGATPFAYAESGYMLDGTTGGKTVLAVTSGKTLTLTAADDYNVTIPATGTVALGTGTNGKITRWTGTNSLGDSAIYDNGTVASIGAVVDTSILFKVEAANPSITKASSFSNIYTGTDTNYGVVFSSNTRNNGLGSVGVNQVFGVIGSAALDALTADTRALSVIGNNSFWQVSANSTFTAQTTTAAAFFAGAPATGGAGTVTVTTAAGMYIKNQGFVGVTNAYGLYVETQSGASTNNNPIYVQGGTSFFDTGNIGIGIATALDRLQIQTANPGSGEVIAASLGGAGFGNTAGGTETLAWRYIGGATILGKIQGVVVSGGMEFAFQTYNGSLAEIFRIGQSSITAKSPGNTAGIKTIATIDAARSGAGANGDGGSILLSGKSSTTAAQPMALVSWEWISATHASRTAKGKLIAYDTAAREGLGWGASGTAPTLSFYGGTLVARGAALTAADASAINSGDATTDAVIANMRTRIGELEARLNAATGCNLIA